MTPNRSRATRYAETRLGLMLAVACEEHVDRMSAEFEGEEIRPFMEGDGAMTCNYCEDSGLVHPATLNAHEASDGE